MRVYPFQEFICEECGGVMLNKHTLTPTIKDGVMLVQARCTTRACRVRGVLFLISVPGVEVEAVPVESEDR
jgi:hypothetical protein